MEGRGEGAVSKPTGANKRKGANPVRQIIGESTGGGGPGGPLDLSLNPEVNKSKKVILSVPQYKLVTSLSSSSVTSSLSDQSRSTKFNPKAEPELSVTPVIKKELSNGDSNGEHEDLDYKSDLMRQNNLALHSLLSSQSQTLFSLEQLKQASLIFQKHALNGNSVPGLMFFLFYSYSKL